MFQIPSVKTDDKYRERLVEIYSRGVASGGMEGFAHRVFYHVAESWLAAALRLETRVVNRNLHRISICIADSQAIRLCGQAREWAIKRF